MTSADLRLALIDLQKSLDRDGLNSLADIVRDARARIDDLESKLVLSTKVVDRLLGLEVERTKLLDWARRVSGVTKQTLER